MSSPKGEKAKRSRLVPALVFLLLAAAAGAALWFFLFRAPEGLADTELTGFLPRGAAITANETQGKTQTVTYSYGTEHAYCDVDISARQTFRYAGGSWTPDGQKEVLEEDEDWSQLAGVWTDEAAPGLSIEINGFSKGAAAGAVADPDGGAGLFNDYFVPGQRQSDGSYPFTGKDALAGVSLRIDRDRGLLLNGAETPMEKDAAPKPTPTPSGALQISKDGKTETVNAAAAPEPEGPKTLAATAVLNVRPQPGTDMDPLGTVEIGTVLPYTAFSDGWYTVEYQGQTGYVSGDYIQDLSDPDGPTVTLLTADAQVNVRSAPGTDSEILTTVDAGSKMIAVGLQEGWYQIRYNAGHGYVSADYVTAGQTLN